MMACRAHRIRFVFGTHRTECIILAAARLYLRGTDEDATTELKMMQRETGAERMWMLTRQGFGSSIKSSW